MPQEYDLQLVQFLTLGVDLIWGGRSIAFDEMARRIRVGWSALEGKPYWDWSPIDITRRPNAIEMEWVLLRLSQRFNDVAPELEQEQNVRIKELEDQLDEDLDSLEVKYYNDFAANLRRHDKDDGT